MRSVIKGGKSGDVQIAGIYMIEPETALPEVEQPEDIQLSPEAIAESILQQARYDAEDVVASAQREAEAIRSAAYQDGYDKGYQELNSEKATIAERISEVEADAQAQLDKYIGEMEPEVLKLAVAVAKQIIGEAAGEKQDLVLDTIKSGLRQLKERHEIKIRVSPDEYEYVREHKEDIICSCDGVRSVEVIDDRRVDPGGCVIETTNGHLDARIATQLSEVERSLMEAIDDGRAEIASDA